MSAVSERTVCSGNLLPSAAPITAIFKEENGASGARLFRPKTSSHMTGRIDGAMFWGELLWERHMGERLISHNGLPSDKS